MFKEMCKNWFTNRVVDEYKKLSSHIISTNMIESFKYRLPRFMDGEEKQCNNVSRSCHENSPFVVSLYPCVSIFRVEQLFLTQRGRQLKSKKQKLEPKSPLDAAPTKNRMRGVLILM